MGRRRAERRPPPPPLPPRPPEEDRLASFRRRLAAMAAGAIAGPILRLHGAIFIAAAGLLLIIAWQSAPQRLLDARQYAAFTARADGRIVESWLALVWRPSDMDASHLRWHAYAITEPCAVVEYDAGGQWGAQRR